LIILLIGRNYYSVAKEQGKSQTGILRNNSSNPHKNLKAKNDACL
jgi:hypothetical protein